jgi:ribosomal protein S18 acetylase RimI-like enzyme
MRALEAFGPTLDLEVRPGKPADIPSLFALEARVFATDRLSRRGFRRLLASPAADLLVAEHSGAFAGYVLVLFRANSAVARIYSLAVAPEREGLGIGTRLIEAAEDAAHRRGCTRIRLEVHEANARAAERYRKSGYTHFGEYRQYYGDRGNALRFEKRLALVPPSLPLPPYIHQSSEFTCGPASMMMALAWADPRRRLDPALEFKLWREATAIVMASGPGGCEPYGIAVTLRRHGLLPEIYVSRPGPYFLDTVPSEDARRVMRQVQAEFRHEAGELGIHTHLTPIRESVLINAFETGAAAVVLVSGYRMVRRRIPHWVFAFGRQGANILLHDPAARRDSEGRALARETYSVPWTKFDNMMRLNRENLRAAVVVRKGPSQ